MWVIIRTLKGKNSFPTESGQWSQDRKDAERFDRYDYAVYYRDKEVGPRELLAAAVVGALLLRSLENLSPAQLSRFDLN